MINSSRTKIIATLGPSTSSKKVLCDMIREGLDVFRLNFSHGSHEEKAEIIKKIREIEKETGSNVAIMGDLQGPKLRVGKISNEPKKLKEGDTVSFTSDISLHSNENIYISYDNLAQDIKLGDRILLDDGKIKLKCTFTDKKKSIKAKVIHEGLLFSKKGVNLPDTSLRLPSLTEQDKEDTLFAINNDIDWLALSFVRSSKDISALRKYIDKWPVDIKIIGKIEKPEAVEDIDDIIDASDGIMVARGDLGVEVSFDKVPVLQKMIVEKCIHKTRPVIIATQMLESMINSFRPTRAEANDVANAVLDGADALMLSGETSVGNFPVETIRAMESIIKYTERNRNIYYNRRLPNIATKEFLPDSICYNACVMAEQTNAKAIVSFTYSGYTTYRLSGQRPKAKIFAFTGNKRLLRKLPLLWGLNIYYTPFFDNIDKAISHSTEVLLKEKLIEKGDYVIHVASTPLNLKKRANMIKLTKV